MRMTNGKSNRVSTSEACHSFATMAQWCIKQLDECGKERTSETYRSALKSFMRFRNDEDVNMNEMDSALMLHYEAYLKLQGLTMNTISFYMRILRAVYNRAVDSGIIVQQYPFKNVYTGVARTKKRSITIGFIKEIKHLELPLHSSLDMARDLFMFSFYMRGMSFIDLVSLKNSNLKDGRLTYSRRKTGQSLTIKWLECMRQIIEKHHEDSHDYLLPVISECGDFRRQYDTALHRVNYNLKRIGAMLGLQMPLTMYVARHSWASVARSINIPLSIISDALGHDSELTTQIYLSSLDASLIDDANERIIESIG